MPTKIEWAEETWNPITGCSKISPGCRNCYAERHAKRFAGRFGYPKSPNQFYVTLHFDKLKTPSSWKKPRKIFVCSMSDIMHPRVEPLWFALILDQIHKNPHHVFILLTKRPERMINDHLKNTMIKPFFDPPMPNLWFGVTVENQDYEIRVRNLLKIPAAVHFVSVEPMLGYVNVASWGWRNTAVCDPRVDWVICGGESGSKARPMHPYWTCRLRDDCIEAGVPFMFKQWGEWAPCDKFRRALSTSHQIIIGDNGHARSCGSESLYDSDFIMGKYGKKEAGRMLDGVIWDQYPEVKP